MKLACNTSEMEGHRELSIMFTRRHYKEMNIMINNYTDSSNIGS